MTSKPGSPPIEAEIDAGRALLLPDPNCPRAYILLVNGVQQSYVNLDDPADVRYRYARRMMGAVNFLFPCAAPVRALHIGAGALTMPRYLATTRPGSSQLVVDNDARLIELVKRHLPWEADSGIRVEVGDGREKLAGQPDGAYDIVILDAFVGVDPPHHLASLEFVQEVARILAPSGWYLINLLHSRMLQRIRDQVATVRSVLPSACLVANGKALHDLGTGNVVLLAGRSAPPVEPLARWAARDWFDTRVLAGDTLDRFVAGTQAISDASPPPPPLPEPEVTYSQSFVPARGRPV